MSPSSALASLRTVLTAEAARFEAAAIAALADPDARAVHDLRVAARRWRSLLTTFAPLLRRRPSAALARELRRLGRMLAALREIDVLAESLESIGQSTLAHQVLRGRGALESEFRRGFTVAAAAQAVSDVTAFARTPPVRRSIAGSDDAQGKAAFDAAVRDAERDFTSAVRHARGRADVHELHRLRLTAKRLRYSLEAAALLDPGTQLRSRPAERLHKAVGDYLDARALREWLREVAQLPDIARSIDIEAARQRALAAVRKGTD